MTYNLKFSMSNKPGNLNRNDIDNVIESIQMAESELGHAEDAIPLLQTGLRIARIVGRKADIEYMEKRIARWARLNK